MPLLTAARAWIRDIDAGNPGAVRARIPTSVAFSVKMPGMPDGRYAVINYATAFAGKEKTVESVILRREADGLWRGVGYRVQ